MERRNAASRASPRADVFDDSLVAGRDAKREDRPETSRHRGSRPRVCDASGWTVPRDEEKGGPVGRDLLRVLVVDDHRMFAESVARILGDEADLEVVGVVGSAEDARAAAASTQPDVVLMDFGLPDVDGATMARLLRDAHPSVQIVMLTGQIDDLVFAAAIEAGCVGLVTKDKASSELLSAVRAAGAGELAIPPATLARLLPILRRDGQGAKPQLTAREQEVLELLVEGAATATIAERLFVSPNTVRNHVQRILVKLEVHSKLEAVAVALRLGLVDKPR